MARTSRTEGRCPLLIVNGEQMFVKLHDTEGKALLVNVNQIRFIEATKSGAVWINFDRQGADHSVLVREPLGVVEQVLSLAAAAHRISR